MKAKFPISNFQFQSEKGFTLLEILLVLAIMGFFTAVVMANLGGTGRRAEIRIAVTEMHNIARAITGGAGAEAGFWADTGVLPEDRHINPGRNEDHNVDGTFSFDPDMDEWIAVDFNCPVGCGCCTPHNCPVGCLCCTQENIYINGNDYYYAYSLRFLGLSGGNSTQGNSEMTDNYVGPTSADPWALARDDAGGVGFLDSSDLEWDPVTGRGWRGGAGEAYLSRESCPASQALVLPRLNSRGDEPPNGYEANLEAFQAVGWQYYIRPQDCPPQKGRQFVHETGCRPVFLDPWGSPYQFRIPYRPTDVDINDHHVGQVYRYAYLLSLGPNKRRDVKISGPNTYSVDIDQDGNNEYNAVDLNSVSHAGKTNMETDDILVYCFGPLPDMIPRER